MSLFSSRHGIDFKKHAAALRSVLAATAPFADWPGSADLAATIDKIIDNFTADMAALEKEARFVFLPSEDSDDLARNNASLLRRWQIQENEGGFAPSLAALCVFAARQLHLMPGLEDTRRLLVAAFLGEVQCGLSYHNTLHYKKVLLQALQMAAAHNGIYDGTRRALNPSQILVLMTAACAHDLGHDGKGNTVKGLHQPGRLERHACDIVAHYFRASACMDNAIMTALRTMILSTDVSPLGDASNYMNQMKSAYRRHFFGNSSKESPLNLDPDLKALENDEALAVMSLLLHEADIATSAGIDYEVTKYETILYRQEIGDSSPRPQQILDFLNEVCQRRMLSDAGQQLYAANMARIYALAEQDVRGGNQSLPAPEQSGFVRGLISDSDRTGFKTIN